MSKDKEIMSTSIAQVILAIMVIAILFIPAYAGYEVERRTATHILEIQGLYQNGTDILAYEPIDETHLQSLFLGEIKIGSMSTPDSYYMKHQGVEYINFTNFVTYLGNGNYSVTPNYTIQSTPYQWRSIGIPLNITASDFVSYDFIRLTTNDEHTAKYIRAKSTFSGGSRTTAWQQLDNNTYILTSTLGLQNQLAGTYPNERIYIEWNGNTPTALDDTDANWIFKIEGFNLEPEHQLFWQDEHLVYGSIAVGLTVMIITLVFTTNYIDVKLDKSKRKR
jgi:hypothetical protein